MNQDEEFDHLFKILLVGDTGVGKTLLLNRYIKGNIPKTTNPTIGVEFATKTVTLKNKEKAKAQIWDTAGQERYRAITRSHYRKTVGALLVYDITKEASFNSIHSWMEELKYNADPDLVIMVVGNKVDLTDRNSSLRKVSKADAQNFAAENKLLFEETSAITAFNVSDVFEKLLEEVYLTKKCSENSKIGGNDNDRPRVLGNTNGPKTGCC